MKCKKIMETLFLVLCLLFVFTCTKTEAKQTCTTQEQNDLIQLAHNVKFSYELLPDLGSNDRLFAITISNLIEGLEIRYGFSVYKYDKKQDSPGVARMFEAFANGQTHKISIYASDNTNCSGALLTTKLINIPKYNSYSERDECKGIEEFKLCNQWYAGNIKDTEFKKQVQQYKESLKNNSEEKKQDEEKQTIIEKIVQLYHDNPIAFVAISLLSLLLVILIIVKIIKRKNRVKIDL